MMKQVLVADDHAMMRAALAGMVALGWPDADVTTAEDFTAAVAAAAGRDLILCDLAMPDMGPVDGIHAVRTAAPDTPLIVVTGQDDDDLLIALFGLGISGFIPKTSDGQVFEAAIRLVLAGGQYLPPRLLALAGGRDVPAAVDTSILTARQLDVLRLMAEGISNKEIARRLDLSPATVKAHAAAVFNAMGVGNRTEAAYRARAAGLLDG
ncbi:LuxR family transcriptional regulator [Sphingomonas antarctica]|uniref:LuxR C-terminal-related transcriptional regulator n=1 Tax=Sphingomonas antarctica TaxID=2040274 RepID=UPI0039EB6539